MRWIIILTLLLFGCKDLEEGTIQRKTASVKISYKNLTNAKATRAITAQQDLIPVYHYVSIEPDVEVLWLDNTMVAEVFVPLNTPLWVEYINWTEEQPNIYYQYGVSKEFIVSFDSPERIKIWIDVEINPNYPISDEEDDEDIADDDDDEDIADDDEDIADDDEDEDTETESTDINLLVHYEFEGDLTDSSLYERDLTEEGEITYSGSDFDNNISGQAAWFDGESWAYTEEIDSDVIGSTDNWTISFWILPDLYNQDFDQWHSVMSSGDSTSSGRFQIDHNGNEQLRAFGYLAIDMEQEWMFFTYTKTTDNETGDNQKIRAYKNGVLETYLYPMSTLWDKLKIGSNRMGGGYWYGYIDDFRIYDKPLTENEIIELYESYE